VIRTNGVVDVKATFGTPRPNQAGFYTNPPYTTFTTGLAYSNFIAAPVSAALIPYVQGRINDDDDFDATGVYGSRKIELVRLPAADGSAHVRFRFSYAGTCSWFFGIDDLGLYEIGFPIINTQPASQNQGRGNTSHIHCHCVSDSAAAVSMAVQRCCHPRGHDFCILLYR